MNRKREHPEEQPTDTTEKGYEFPLARDREEVLADFETIAEPDEPEDESGD